MAESFPAKNSADSDDVDLRGRRNGWTARKVVGGPSQRREGTATTLPVTITAPCRFHAGPASLVNG
jgi:hypothetical protein